VEGMRLKDHRACGIDHPRWSDPRFETISKLVTPELAYVVWIERQKAKMGANDELTHSPLGSR